MPNLKSALVIKNLSAGIGEKIILKNISLVLKPGKLVALMGPNGSGKSTLAHVLMGRPGYRVQTGQALWRGKNILKLKTDERARLGLFLGFQQPVELPGVNLLEFLIASAQACCQPKPSQTELETEIKRGLKSLRLSPDFLERSVNEGFSGGEKKKIELLQLLLLKPKIAILDEADSGLDIDALKLIARGIQQTVRQGTGVLVITHYQRLLNYLDADQVLVLLDGRIVKTGAASLVWSLERRGYDWLKNPRKTKA